MAHSVREVKDELLERSSGKLITEKLVQFLEELNNTGWNKRIQPAPEVDVDTTALLSDEEYDQLIRRCMEITTPPQQRRAW